MSFVKIRSWAAGLLVLALVGCGGGGGSDAGTPVLPGTGSGTGSGSGGTTTASPTVEVAVSSSTVTAASPAVVTVTVRDAKGVPMAGKVVDLKTARGTLATLDVSSVATDVNGSASAVLSANATGLSGADEVVAVAVLGTTTVQGSAAFTVSGSVPTLGLTASATTLKLSAGEATVRAVLKDAAGNLVANQAVNFNAAANGLTLSAPSAVTDGFGAATIKIKPANAGVTAAEVLTASSNVRGEDVIATLVLQLLADTPSISVSVSNSNVSATAPATLSVLVKDDSGAPVVAGTVVNVLSSFGLTAFDAATSATDASGLATVVVSPKTSTSNGADQIVLSATVGGVAVMAKTVVQVSSATSSTAQPVLQTALSSTSISAATPATVTATLTDGKGGAVAGQVVSFAVVRGLAKTNVGTALTDATGMAVVILSPSSSTVAGADEVTASVSFAGTDLQSTKGFQIQSTNVTLGQFTSAVPTLGAYGQTTLTLEIIGASVGAPVNVSVTSSCVSLGKATLSPSTFTATTATVDLQLKDNGCGALQSKDKLQAAIVGSASQPATLELPVSVPSASSLAFITAAPEVIYIKASGFTETSTLTFEVRDGAGNILPNRSVTLTLLTRSGGVTMEGGIADVIQVSDAAGRVTVRVNSGTIPTPVRVAAKLTDTPAIATVSSNLSVAVGLPSQLNFSLSQQTKNIEGFNIDGTPNAYNIIASDRSGNPVPSGTSINFVTEGGQVESIRQVQLVAGLARASAQFISADPRPADGRVTVTAYALGEESFIDQNGNNAYDAVEPFQDLGRVFKDRLFDGPYDSKVDEYIPTNIDDGQACLAPSATPGSTAATNALLAFDASIPSVGGSTCDTKWSGAGKVYVRRATETVLSTSAARVLWGSKSGLDASCGALTLQVGSQPAGVVSFTPVQGDTWYGSGSSISLPFIVADANTFPAVSDAGAIGRLNPLAAGTAITARTPTTDVSVTVGGGTPVPSTTEATTALVGVTFGQTAPSSALVFVTFTSPSGLGTTYAVTVQRVGAAPLPSKPSNCP